MDTKQFVQSVKFYCERKCVKPTVACREAGVGTSFINNIEARGQVPSVERVQMLARYLGVTTSELLGESNCGDSVDRDLRPEDHWLLERYHHADARTREIIDQILEPFAKEKTTSATG